MPQFEVTKSRFFAGTWEGVVSGATGPSAPAILVSHLDRELGHDLTPDPGRDGDWLLQIAVPPELLSDGVQVFLITARETGEKLASFTIIAGEPLEDDIRAETELLRAELDMLKRAFRRHCLETG